MLPSSSAEINRTQTWSDAALARPRIKQLVASLARCGSGGAAGGATAFGTPLASAVRDAEAALTMSCAGIGEAASSRSASELISCQHCGSEGAAGTARAYVQGPPLGIVLCANRLRSAAEVEESLVHELTHLYDLCVSRKDLRKCEPLAYSEVRAARNAECGGANASSLEWRRRWCVKGVATRATAAMFPDRADDCIEAVFEEAMRDVRPAVLDDAAGGAAGGGAAGVLGTSPWVSSGRSSAGVWRPRLGDPGKA